MPGSEDVMTARTSPTVSASALAAVIEERYPDFDVPVMPAPRLSPRQVAEALLALLGQTPAETARLADFRSKSDPGMTLSTMLSDDLINAQRPVRLPLRPAYEEPSWLISTSQARRISRVAETQFLPVFMVLSAPFAEVDPAFDADNGLSDFPLHIPCGVLAELADLLETEVLAGSAGAGGSSIS
jgi:hypothetical protein